MGILKLMGDNILILQCITHNIYCIKNPDTANSLEADTRVVAFLENYYSPSELEDQIGVFVDYYNHDRYHEALNNVTPADVYYARDLEVLERRVLIKQKTMLLRRK